MTWRTHWRTGTAHAFYVDEDEADDPEFSHYSACGRITSDDCDKSPEKKRCKSCREGIGGRRSWEN